MQDLRISNPYRGSGEWWKGNLHAHSTNSDGMDDPREVAEWYLEHGYDFLAITDHHLVTLVEDFESEMVLIPGAEIGEVDVVAVGVRGELVDERLDIGGSAALAERLGGLAFVAHPYWTGLGAGDIAEHSGFIGMEVFNTICQYLNGKGLATCIWDELLGQGVRLWGLVNDDAHAVGESRFGRPQSGRAWLMVNAARKEEQAILRALREGAFYGTQGPRIEAVECEGAMVRVRCSPVREVRFVARASLGRTYYAGSGPMLESAEYEVRAEDSYVRIECVDEEGNTAWSQPLWVEEAKEEVSE